MEKEGQAELLAYGELFSSTLCKSKIWLMIPIMIFTVAVISVSVLNFLPGQLDVAAPHDSYSVTGKCIITINIWYANFKSG